MASVANNATTHPPLFALCWLPVKGPEGTLRLLSPLSSHSIRGEGKQPARRTAPFRLVMTTACVHIHKKTPANDRARRLQSPGDSSRRGGVCVMARPVSGCLAVMDPSVHLQHPFALFSSRGALAAQRVQRHVVLWCRPRRAHCGLLAPATALVSRILHHGDRARAGIHATPANAFCMLQRPWVSWEGKRTTILHWSPASLPPLPWSPMTGTQPGAETDSETCKSAMSYVLCPRTDRLILHQSGKDASASITPYTPSPSPFVHFTAQAPPTLV